jgi:isoquinoline 1-oxidoreductase beta subunit
VVALVYASTNGFAYESFMDELAIEAGKDPLEFRRQHLQEERCQQLIDKLEEVSGWKSRKKNEGFGVAITECFNSTVGEVVKVSKNAEGKIKIDKVWAVMDCGWYVNPDTIHAQVEGSIVMALGAATMHEITFTDGLADQPNFYAYPCQGYMIYHPLKCMLWTMLRMQAVLVNLACRRSHRRSPMRFSI